MFFCDKIPLTKSRRFGTKLVEFLRFVFKGIDFEAETDPEEHTRIEGIILPDIWNAWIQVEDECAFHEGLFKTIGNVLAFELLQRRTLTGVNKGIILVFVWLAIVKDTLTTFLKHYLALCLQPKLNQSLQETMIWVKDLFDNNSILIAASDAAVGDDVHCCLLVNHRRSKADWSWYGHVLE